MTTAKVLTAAPAVACPAFALLFVWLGLPPWGAGMAAGAIGGVLWIASDVVDRG